MKPKCGILHICTTAHTVHASLAALHVVDYSLLTFELASLSDEAVLALAGYGSDSIVTFVTLASVLAVGIVGGTASGVS